MKALIRSGLGLALGLLAARAGAQETQWRASKPSLPDKTLTAPSPVRLGLPQPGGGEDSGMFSGIVRAKHLADDPPLPLPLGPSLKGDAKPVEPKKTFTPGLPSPVADVVLKPGDPTFCGAPGCEPAGCGDGCATTCCGPIRGWFRQRWTDCCGMVGHGCGDSCGDGRLGGTLFGGPILGNLLDGNCCNDDRSRFWINGSYLLWNIKNQQTPPLVVVNPTAAPLTTNPGTMVLLGGDAMDNEIRSGGRFQMGLWFPNNDCWGVDAGYFFLGERVEKFALSSPGTPGTPFIGRFFIDAGPPQFENPQVVAQPGTPGFIQVDHAFRMWGVEAHLRRKAASGPMGWCDLFVGYRHLYMDEKLSILEGPNFRQNSLFVVNDRFGAQNTFNGVDLGWQWERRLGQRWFLQGTCRVALGNINQIVDISGTTTRTLNGGMPETRVGGVAASSTNIGKYSRDRFAVVPECGLKIGFDVTERLRVFAGYDLLWISSVVRAGEQIDPVINRARLPFATGVVDTGVNRPAVLFHTTDFWAQGANFGLEWRF